MTEQDGAAPSLEAQVVTIRGHAGEIRDRVKSEYAQARSSHIPAAYREALVRVRSWQDQLEEYLAFAIAVKGGMERAAADAKDVYDDAWARQAHGNSEAAVRRGEEMEGPRERYARFDVRVFGELRAYRKAQKALLLAGELLDEMWLRYRAVNATREDLANILRAYAFESSLEH